MGTAWWSSSEPGFPVEIVVECRWLSYHSKPRQSKLWFWVFENLIFIVCVGAFLPSPPALTWLPSSSQAVSTASQTPSFETDERHHHRRIVLQGSHWECPNRQCHPAHFKNGACRLQLPNNWSQPLKADGTLLWTKFTVPSWDTRHQIKLLLPGHLRIVTSRVTKIQSIFLLDSLRRM